MRCICLILAPVAFALLAAGSLAQPAAPWREDISLALQSARRDSKPVLVVVCSATRSRYAERQLRSHLVAPDVTARLQEHYHLILLEQARLGNWPKPSRDWLDQTRAQIWIEPLFSVILLDPQGRPFGSVAGRIFSTPAAFADSLTRAAGLYREAHGLRSAASRPVGDDEPESSAGQASPNALALRAYEVLSGVRDDLLVRPLPQPEADPADDEPTRLLFEGYRSLQPVIDQFHELSSDTAIDRARELADSLIPRSQTNAIELAHMTFIQIAQYRREYDKAAAAIVAARKVVRSPHRRALLDELAVEAKVGGDTIDEDDDELDPQLRE